MVFVLPRKASDKTRTRIKLTFLSMSGRIAIELLRPESFRSNAFLDRPRIGEAPKEAVDNRSKVAVNPRANKNLFAPTAATRGGCRASLNVQRFQIRKAGKGDLLAHTARQIVQHIRHSDACADDAGRAAAHAWGIGAQIPVGEASDPCWRIRTQPIKG